MISVQSALLVALGFLIASLVGVLMGSALWARAVRLTTARIKQSMPVSESELQADRARLRAEFAIRVHKLESSLEDAKLERARQFIEINRRDATIAGMQAHVSGLKSDLDEHTNARRVLEQTVADRLPRVEARLAEAKRLLFNRDREIAELTTGAKRHKLALEEASSLSAQQSAQIEKLTTELTSRVRAPKDGRFENELVLRTETETLRAKTREQATLIDRLQQRLSEQGYLQHAPAAQASEAAAREQEIARLRQKLSDAEATLSSVRSAGSDTDASRIAFEREVRALTSRLEDQAGEITRLNAALAVFDRYQDRSASVRESKLLLKARLSSAQSHSDQQAATIGRLRAELASVQERLERQAAHFAEEMQALGQPFISGLSPGRRRVARLGGESVVGRVAEVKPAGGSYPDRNGAVHELASQIKRAQARLDLAQEDAESTAPLPEQTRRLEDHKGNGAGKEPGRDSWTDLTQVPQEGIAARAQSTPRAKSEPANGQSSAPGADIAQDLPQPTSILQERRRPRLLDRLSGLTKSLG